MIEKFNKLFLFDNRRERKALILESSKIDIGLGATLAHGLDARFE
jgi:hypothetical protein